jgi:hypothetical protein
MLNIQLGLGNIAMTTLLKGNAGQVYLGFVFVEYLEPYASQLNQLILNAIVTK